jgi:hypothetical protein
MYTKHVYCMKQQFVQDLIINVIFVDSREFFTLVFSIIFYTFIIQLLKFIEGLLSLFCFEWASDCCIMSNISAISWQEQVTITMRMMSILYKTKMQCWIFSITQQSTVQQYFSYILAVRFIGGRHYSTATPRKSLMNFNRCHIMYTTHGLVFKLTTFVVIDTY